MESASTEEIKTTLPEVENPATFHKIEALLKDKGIDFFLMTV